MTPTPDELRQQAADLEARAAELEIQLTRSELKSMTPEAITQAKADGRLNDLLGIAKESTNHA